MISTSLTRLMVRVNLISVASMVALLSGCASIPADLGRDQVDQLVSDRGRPVDGDRAALLSSLTSKPLSVENAVRIALLNNPSLQSSYAQLGFGAADVYEAGRIRNPIFSASLLNPDNSGQRDLRTLGLAASFTDLITLGARSRLARDAYAALKLNVGSEVMQMAAQTERMYYRYVGARQVADLRRKVAKAGALSAMLAQRFRDAGNLAPRELAMQRAAASEVEIQALEADAEALSARTELAMTMGISTGDTWSVPSALGMPIAAEDELPGLLQMANEHRLDLSAARTKATVLAERLGVIEWSRWLSDIDIGIELERETDGSRLRGPTIEWQIPLFNQGNDNLARSNAELRMAVNELQRIMIDVDNSVRLAHALLKNSRAKINQYETELIPQRIEAVARAQEEVNFMLIGVFELITMKRDEYDSYQHFVEAIQDYWIAHSNLSLAVGVALPKPAVEVPREPKNETHQHHRHGDRP